MRHRHLDAIPVPFSNVSGHPTSGTLAPLLRSAALILVALTAVMAAERHVAAAIGAFESGGTNP